MTVLAADSLSVHTAEASPLVSDVSLSLSRGETGLLCGPPGSGKTMVAKALRGLLDDREDLRLSGSVTRNGSIGFVFQRAGTQLVRRVVRRDVAFGLENRGLPVDEIEERIERYAALIDAGGLLDRRVRELSSGETKTVALLGVLVTEPDVVLLDEPLSSLDHPSAIRMLEAIDHLRAHGTAVLIAEHDPRDVLSRADWVVLLDAGRVVAHRPPEDIVSDLQRAGVALPYPTEVALARRDAGDDGPIPLEVDP